jgi:hypothetical protein
LVGVAAELFNCLQLVLLEGRIPWIQMEKEKEHAGCYVHEIMVEVHTVRSALCEHYIGVIDPRLECSLRFVFL